MSQIRKAHTVEIIDRRLRQYETAGVDDAMELVGLHDELARVERKWLEKAARRRAGDAGTRPLANVNEHNARFQRLGLLVDAALRRDAVASPAQRLLQQIADTLHARKPAEA